MEQVKFENKRHFRPHLILIAAANTALDDATKGSDGSFHYELMAITFSALAIEALANSFGDHLIDKWGDFESANPTAKLRLVCDKLKIQINFGEDPWQTARWLMRFRNKIAHAKPEKIEISGTITPEEYEKKGRDCPTSDIEQEITLEKAKRSVESIEKIVAVLCEKLSPSDSSNLQIDGWSGSASRIVVPE